MVILDKNSPTPLYEQIALDIKKQINAGILRPDDKLPSVREQAKELLINPMTISKAYQALTEEGVIASRKGVGVFVSDFHHADEDKIPELQKKFTQLLIELRFNGVSDETIIEWLKA
ncbi:MAG: GntR family transcriptional regulator [Lactobacillales bacterium]|jgi:GntR family transcriptional regulator|nr:GntR family transcriptional regulator [Lactobacillales bacterium]